MEHGGVRVSFHGHQAAVRGAGDSTMKMDRMADIPLLLLRVVSGLLFLQAGGMKLLDWFGGIPAEMGGHPAFPSQVWIGGFLELVGGTAILLGLCTKPVAFVLSGEMAVAYFQFHQPGGLWPIQNHGEPAVLFCFIFLYFAVRGAGPLSLDGVLRARRAARA
jgi:putative oxidoreductase